MKLFCIDFGSWLFGYLIDIFGGWLSISTLYFSPGKLINKIPFCILFDILFIDHSVTYGVGGSFSPQFFWMHKFFADAKFYFSTKSRSSLVHFVLSSSDYLTPSKYRSKSSKLAFISTMISSLEQNLFPSSPFFKLGNRNVSLATKLGEYGEWVSNSIIVVLATTYLCTLALFWRKRILSFWRVRSLFF